MVVETGPVGGLNPRLKFIVTGSDFINIIDKLNRVLYRRSTGVGSVILGLIPLKFS